MIDVETADHLRSLVKSADRILVRPHDFLPHQLSPSQFERPLSVPRPTASAVSLFVLASPYIAHCCKTMFGFKGLPMQSNRPIQHSPPSEPLNAVSTSFVSVEQRNSTYVVGLNESNETRQRSSTRFSSIFLIFVFISLGYQHFMCILHLLLRLELAWDFTEGKKMNIVYCG